MSLEELRTNHLYINDLSMHDSSRDLLLASVQQSAELQQSLEQVRSFACICIYGVGRKKWGHKLTTTILSNPNQFTQFLHQKIQHTSDSGRFLGKFAVNWLLKISSFFFMLPHYLVKH